MDTSIENNTSIEFLEINKKLEQIIDFDGYIYKINNGYEQYDAKKILDMIEKIKLL